MSKPRPLNQPCHAVANFWSVDAPHYAIDRMRGSCQWRARYYRDGKPVCGVHLRAKTVEFYDPGEFIREQMPERLWPA